MSDFRGCEDPPSTVGMITFTGDLLPTPFVTIGTVAFVSESTGLRIRVDERPPEPTLDELLACVADTTQPLARRLAATQEVEHRLGQEIERKCEEIFPDFYWRHSDACSVEERGRETVRFPQANKSQPDFALTPERDKALRDLGFVYLGDQRLGLTTGEVLP